MEFERLTNRKANGAAGVHGLFVLVADRVLLVDGGVRTAAHLAGAGQGVHGVHPAAQLVLQPLPLRHPHQAVQEGLRAHLQGDRGVARHQGHRPLPPQLQLQQPPDAGQHQQHGGQVVARAPALRLLRPQHRLADRQAARAEPAHPARRPRRPE